MNEIVPDRRRLFAALDAGTGVG